MVPKELNKLKAAMTMTSIDEREAYARYKEHRQHIASFCGTGNNVQFLSDTTGNRRWLPFEVCNIESPRSSPFNYEGIYSQAYALYRQGFRYWFDASEVRRLSQHNEQFETPQTERELVDLFFRKPMKHESGEFMPVGLAVQIVGGNNAGSLSKEKMGRAFMDLGFDYRRTSSARGYIVVKRSDEERNLYRIQLASGTDASVTDDSMTAHF
jgi:predicted P-loop ATPase